MSVLKHPLFSQPGIAHRTGSISDPHDWITAMLCLLDCPHTSSISSVINAADRTIYRTSRYDHITSLLKELYWLRGSERIEFKLCALVYNCLNGNGPAYLADSLQTISTESDGRPVTSTPAVVFVVNADRPGNTSSDTG